MAEASAATTIHDEVRFPQSIVVAALDSAMLASLRLDAKILSTPKIKNTLDINPNKSYSTYYRQHHLLLSVHLHP